MTLTVLMRPVKTDQSLCLGLIYNGRKRHSVGFLIRCGSN